MGSLETLKSVQSAHPRCRDNGKKCRKALEDGYKKNK